MSCDVPSDLHLSSILAPGLIGGGGTPVITGVFGISDNVKYQCYLCSEQLSLPIAALCNISYSNCEQLNLTIPHGCFRNLNLIEKSLLERKWLCYSSYTL